MKAVFRVLWLFALAVSLAPASMAEPAPQPAPRTAPQPIAGPRLVRSVVDGDTVVLDDRRQVRLVGIQAPKLPLGRRGFKTQPLADEARAALVEMVEGKPVTLSYGGLEVDRHGRALAHLADERGRFVQAEMLRRGFARVYSFEDNRSRLDELYAAEREARAARRGIWAHPFYRIRSPEELGPDIDSFQVVEGRIVQAAARGGRIYLNFGADRHTDFTVGIAPQATRLFRAAKLDPGTWSGRRVRVRGWIEQRDGPAIEATHPEQIELLD
jgi:endonuclease YncB( thermonuclease family)